MSNYLKDLEDSRLLFKTFCDGLMYGMYFYHGETLHRVTSINGLDDTVNGVYPIRECRPCLRPMSSMTEEEEREVRILWNEDFADKISLYHCYPKTTDFYNKNHFDYRGLIEKDLALPATENMYK